MAITSKVIRTVTGTKPLYAVAGASDLVVEQLRQRLAALLDELEPKAVGHTIPDRVGTLWHSTHALEQKAASTYGDLAERGRNLVDRIRGGRPVAELLEQADAAVRRARIARHPSTEAVAAPTRAEAKKPAMAAVKLVKLSENRGAHRTGDARWAP